MPSRQRPAPTPGRRLLACFLLAFACLGGTAAAQPADSPPPADTAPAQAPTETVLPAQASPRAVLEAFFKRMREDDKQGAAELLDLSELSAIAAESRGPDLAYKLFRLIPAVGTPPKLGGKTIDPVLGPGGPDAGDLDFEGVPAESDAESPWPLSGWLQTKAPEAAELLVSRDESGVWRFDASTVDRIDALYERFEEPIDQRVEEIAEQKATAAASDSVVELAEPTETTAAWIRRSMPRPLRKTYFVMPTYQWLLLLLLLPIGRLVDKLARLVLTATGDRVLRRIDPEFIDDRGTTARVWRPVGRLAMASTWVAGAFATDMPPAVTTVLLTALAIVAIVAAVLAAFRVLDLVQDFSVRRARRTKRKFDDLFIPLATTTAKVLTVVAGFIAALVVLNQELPTALLGGLGIGGIAIALASQETLSNLVGSITLLFDRPFEVGDWVNIDGVEGEVESLGFRSTKLRTGLNSQVSLPNSKLAAASVDNLGRRKYRRYLAKLGLEYGTPPELIETFCEGVRELIRRHPHTRKDFYAAYFNDFAASSLDVIVVAYFETPDWVTELRERHRLLLDIARLADSIGVSFAFPTQTLHLRREPDDGTVPTETPPPADNPAMLGARAAAEIAGELPNYQDRPGRVKFPGPTKLPDDPT